MKWHKISDGDYPNIYDNVLVASMDADREYNHLMMTMATYSASLRWLTDFGMCNVLPTDRWTYIDLPTD